MSKLHFLALDNIYAINLVQFEHALGYAIEQQLHGKKEELNKLLKSTTLTISGQEELKALELSILVSENKMSLEEAANIHKKEFASVNLAYGATQGQTENDSYDRIAKLTSVSFEKRTDRIQQLREISKSTSENKEQCLLDELSNLAKKLGERRDRNKALMGRVAGARKIIMDYISSRIGVSREDLRSYFLQNIFNLLIKNEKVSSEMLEKRRERLVLQRRENTIYGVEAIQLSEQVFPDFFRNRDSNIL